MSEILILQVMVISCTTVALVATLGFVRRVLELKHERRAQAPADDLAARLERIELTVDSTAVEVERVAEANRFLSKLLTDRAPVANAPAEPHRVITPH